MNKFDTILDNNQHTTNISVLQDIMSLIFDGLKRASEYLEKEISKIEHEESQLQNDIILL